VKASDQLEVQKVLASAADSLAMEVLQPDFYTQRSNVRDAVDTILAITRGQPQRSALEELRARHQKAAQG
jgi:hypothetical protein